MREQYSDGGSKLILKWGNRFPLISDIPLADGNL
jgi:hypothetical protein